jgi:hypothetical protein
MAHLGHVEKVAFCMEWGGEENRSRTIGVTKPPYIRNWFLKLAYSYPENGGSIFL